MYSAMTLPVPVFNTLLSLATLLFVDQAVGLVNAIQKQSDGRLSILQSRKMIHLVATSTVLGWPLFDTSHWTWRLASLTCGLYSIKLLAHGLGVVPADPDFFRTMTRTGRRLELCQGPLLFASIVFLICNFQFKTDLGTYLIAAMGIGDGFAPLVGTMYPWKPFRSLGGEQKTVSGSLAMFAGTFMGIFLLSRLLGAPVLVDSVFAMQVAIVATIAEAASGAWDNIAVPLAILALAKLAS